MAALAGLAIRKPAAGANTTAGHCPIVPVYQGRFRVIQQDVVFEDVRRQAAARAEHITFGNPDFFNGPGHALPLVRALVLLSGTRAGAAGSFINRGWPQGDFGSVQRIGKSYYNRARRMRCGAIVKPSQTTRRRSGRLLQAQLA